VHTRTDECKHPKHTEQNCPFKQWGEGRGTAILVKEVYKLAHIRYMPSGRGIVATFNDVQMANIYAPSDATKRKTRKDLYNVDVRHLLGYPSSTLLLVENFNCFLQAQDCTVSQTISRVLRSLIMGLELYDTWDQRHGNRQYTHYTAKGARIDRIYTTRNIMAKKQTTVLYAVAFTDYPAVILHTRCLVTTTTPGRGLWEMNVSMLQYEHTLLASRTNGKRKMSLH
jgi:exonuclease III